ncbi:MAG: hypothetical protein AAF420_08675 [Pseudomonadota bacterium]
MERNVNGPSQPRWPLFKRLACVQLAIFALTLCLWFFFTDRTQGKLAEVLFWIGVASLGLGVAILCGAWRGLRDADVDLIMGPSHKRHARQFGDVQRAYADLNVFALAGCISIIVSLII